MQLAGTTSWRIGTDEPQLLLMALYVRDASGLRPRVDPNIAPLEPAVPLDNRAAVFTRAASVQWAGWWHQLLEGGGFWPEHKSPSDLHRLRQDPEIQRLFYWPSQHLPPDFAGLSSTPELQALVRRQYEAARVWSEARHLEFAALSSARLRVSLESEIVRTVERSLGRTARNAASTAASSATPSVPSGPSSSSISRISISSLSVSFMMFTVFRFTAWFTESP